MGTQAASGNVHDAHKLSRAATFWISLLATCVVILLPTSIVSLMVRTTSWTPHPAAMWSSTAILSLMILMAGTRWWMRQPGSTTMSFGELMLWRWVRRYRADGVVQGGSILLDTDEVRTRSGQLEMLRALNGALEVRDPYTRGHSRRVERHAYRTALAMHRSVEDIFNLRVAASLHDIGKIEVPIEVIRKQGPLDDNEWVLMKSHPAAGAQMIANIGHEALVLAVRHHHERWDGKGYPDGLAGDDIPLHARIIAVCDTFDAITSTRSYRSKSQRGAALEIIKKNSGTQFDPEVVDAFLSALPRGAPSVAALSWLSFPALQKGLSQASLMFREAGIAGVAGAMATSGIAGALATTVVNPAKYLKGPAIVRAQADEHASDRARAAAARSAIVLGTSVADADGKASRHASSRARRPEPNRAQAKSNNRGRAKNPKGRDKAPGRAAAATEKREKRPKSDNPGQAKKEAGGTVAAANPGNGKVKETIEDTAEAVNETADSSASRIPPGQAKKDTQPSATDDRADLDASESTTDGGSTDSPSSASKEKDKPK